MPARLGRRKVGCSTPELTFTRFSRKGIVREQPRKRSLARSTRRAATPPEGKSAKVHKLGATTSGYLSNGRLTREGQILSFGVHVIYPTTSGDAY